MKRTGKKDFKISKKVPKEKTINKLTQSLDADYYNYLKQNDEEKSILNSHFNETKKNKKKIKTKDKNKDIEKEIFISELKSTMKNKSKKSSNSYESSIISSDNYDSSIYNSTLNIDKEKEELKKIRETTSSYTDSIVSEVKEGLDVGSYVFDGAIKISKLLGEGAQAKVYLGVTENEDDDDSQKLVMAIKHFSFDVGVPNPEIDSEIDDLVNKCQTLKELSHDNIIQYFDCEYDFREDTKNFIVNIAMEYQDTNLSDFIKIYKNKNKVSNLPINVIAKITKNIVEGLIYLHDHKIIHRDLKPENILMSLDYKSVKIGDFGISLWIKESQNKMKNKIFNFTRDFMKRSIAGTGIYMSPEVLLGKPYGYDADIWSLGCIVFEMTGGIKPFCTCEKDKKVPTTDLQLVKYKSPLEFADEDVKDIIYDKKNRLLLDFLLNCWRGNNVYRPTAKELLQHPFLNKIK